MTGDLAPDRGRMRASHDDREQAVERLRLAAGDGRLTAEELDERLERAFTARTYAELESLLADLPAIPGGALSPAQPGKDLVQLRTASGHIKRDGPWVVPRRMEVTARSGHVHLDFTQAVITRAALDLTVHVRSGHVRLIVPAGVAVDVDSIEMGSGHVRNRVRQEPGTPVKLTITMSGSVRSGHILVSGPRRSFWDWLLRRPRRRS